MAQDISGPTPLQPNGMTPATVCRTQARNAAGRYASPPIVYTSPPAGARRRTRAITAVPQTWTLGDFLKPATKDLDAALPALGKKKRRAPLIFSPRRRRSCAKTTPACAPPTAERIAHIQILRTLGIIGTDQKITEAEMKVSAGIFAMLIPPAVLAAIAKLVDRELPTCTAATVNVACEEQTSRHATTVDLFQWIAALR